LDSTVELRTRIEALARQLGELSAKDTIRDCIYRINRGIDRIDEPLMASGFHPDAMVRWGTKEHVDLATWIKEAIRVQHTTQRVQHLVGNILIDLRGDEADVESYEIGRHLTPLPNGMKDLIIASRYIDKFARRDGTWRIVRRDKVADWVRIMEGTDPLYEHIPARGERDGTDISFALFGANAFHSGI
jgi:hypothetical protein